MATTWRQRQAEETKKQVLAASRRLFVESGYAGTTIEAIAAEAGVAAATVYKAFGSKAKIAQGLNDLIDEEAGLDDIGPLIESETNPVRLIARVVSQLRHQHECCGDIIGAIRSGAEVEPALADVWAEGTRRYDDEIRRFVTRLKNLRALSRDLLESQAVGFASIICSTETFIILTSRHGWTTAQWETWTTDELRRLLLNRAG
jgi:AcrR family transcriptional regulator